MKINQEFVVAAPTPEVWAFFKDVPRVARCLPGAEYLGPREDGRHAGSVSVKVGPFQANFEGDAEARYEDEAKTVHLSGKGVDRKGASRGRMTMDCRLEPQGEATRVSVAADVQLSGSIAQFGRPGLITEVAGLIVADFARNVEAELTAVPAAGRRPAEAAQPARPIGGLGLLWRSLIAWLRSLLGGRS